MQECNYGETNGIVIGPEFSRVFAEIILQEVDRLLEKRLREDHGIVHRKHYHLLRYVDDYFVFVVKEADVKIIQECIQFCLSEFKMILNEAKSRIVEKPIITPITIAKNRISQLLNEYIYKETASKESLNSAEEKTSFVGSVNSTRLIIGLKTIIQETGVPYPDIMNYLLTILESKRRLLSEHYLATKRDEDDQRRLTKCMVGIMDFAFFSYSATPRVNQSIRLCRLISDTTTFYNQNIKFKDVRHLLYKFIFDHLSHELAKNSVTPFREIETQYLLLAVKQLGRSYSFSLEALARKIHSLGGGCSLTR